MRAGQAASAAGVNTRALRYEERRRLAGHEEGDECAVLIAGSPRALDQVEAMVDPREQLAQRMVTAARHDFDHDAPADALLEAASSRSSRCPPTPTRTSARR